MNLTEKVAYLKGLMDGMNLNADDNQVRLIKAVVDVLDEMALSVCDLEDEVAEVELALDVLDEDLSMLEDVLFDDLHDHDHDHPHYEVECPICGELFYIDEMTALEGETTCPECDAEIEIEIDEDDEDEDDGDED